jgi:hypothetical protein
MLLPANVCVCVCECCGRCMSLVLETFRGVAVAVHQQRDALSGEGLQWFAERN